MSAARAWCAAVSALGGDPAAAAEAAADLINRWAEPHRRYHTTAHLAAVLRDATWLADELRLSRRERAVATLAACAHDVVYAARPGADERASAAWARERLAACGVESAAVDRVVALVLATMDHEAPNGDVEADVLLDADLSVLGSPAPEYANYLAGVRAEYSAVSEQDWRAGRARLLEALLAREPLYRSEPARRRWTAQARRNIAAELAGLSG